ncbi:hypothetical protein [Luteimonas sp. YGD11-2]|uniref:hypothetical protein n=1 Tax=Luteimonas sp. YGD11-2 TaxID=2508168 RepID=UPI00100B5BF4|nr:hypothetical protein [Luteimonas sp. YGD11-2]
MALKPEELKAIALASETVMAYGEHGLEPTAASDVVEISSPPLGAGNLVIPATHRWMRRRPGEGVPTRIRRVLRPGTRLNRGAYPYIEFDCTPFERGMTDAGPIMGDWSGCSLRGRVDADDPLWAALPTRDRARLYAAVEA